mgnify:CR=1 FL=1
MIPVAFLFRATRARKDDLKALLAFSTVSHLGLITMLLGFGTPMAAVVAVFHIINHASFKAALFMSAGIIDHEAHMRRVIEEQNVKLRRSAPAEDSDNTKNV